MPKHLLVGLGNPGDTYAHTRHNIGFRVLDKLSEYLAFPFSEEKKFKGLFAHNGDILLLKPQTFMNDSGQSVRAVVDYFNIDTEYILVIHDELDLPFGQMKLQLGKSAAGHNGVKSIVNHLATQNFWRLRIGIAGEHRENIPGDKYVLSQFSKQEEEALQQQLPKIMLLFKEYIDKGPEGAVHYLTEKQDA